MYRKAHNRERDQAKSRAPGSKIETCKFYSELNFLKDIVTNRVTTTNLTMAESDINVTTPPGYQTFIPQQQMSPSCHPAVPQSGEELLQSTVHTHELATITPKQDKRGKRKTSATDEVNEFDKA